MLAEALVPSSIVCKCGSQYVCVFIRYKVKKPERRQERNLIFNISRHVDIVEFFDSWQRLVELHTRTYLRANAGKFGGWDGGGTNIVEKECVLGRDLTNCMEILQFLCDSIFLAPQCSVSSRRLSSNI